MRRLHTPNLLALLMLVVSLTMTEPRVTIDATKGLALACIMKGCRTRHALLFATTIHLNLSIVRFD